MRPLREPQLLLWLHFQVLASTLYFFKHYQSLRDEKHDRGQSPACATNREHFSPARVPNTRQALIFIIYLSEMENKMENIL